MLRSDRFDYIRLGQVIDGRTLKKGSNGRAVHLVQMALIDLGYKPRTSRRPPDRIGRKPVGRANHIKSEIFGSVSPTEPLFADGVFGVTTEDRLRHFQNDFYLPNTGEIDRRTLLELDALLANYQYRIRVHFRNFPGARPWVQFDLADVQGVYGQYGIKIDYAGGKTIRGDPKFGKFLLDDVQKCKTLSFGKFSKLNLLLQDIPLNEVVIIYTKAIENNFLGCAHGMLYRYRGCAFVIDRSKHTNIVAHELGHILGLDHTTANRENLMFTYPAGKTQVRTLNEKQVAKVRKSVYCQSM